MTSIEYKTLIFPINRFYTIQQFSEYIKTRENGWRQGLINLLKVCETQELYEYCVLIKKELDKEMEETL